MEKLIINVPGAPALEIELKPGLNRFGRSLNTDFQIRHPSVSSLHCEIVVKDGAWTVRDLGSTNGTLLDGKLVQECPMQRGQILRLGDVEIVFTPQNEASPAPPVEEEFSTARFAKSPPLPPPMPGAPAGSTAARVRVTPKRPARPSRSFFAALPGAFVFPLRGSGLILLLTGAVFFVILNFLSGFVGFISAVIGVFCGGYLFTFLKSVITTTALGDDEMPVWPDYEGWLTSGLWPFLEMLAVFLVCLGPALFYLEFAEDYQAWLVGTLLLGGFIYMPMALLALAIYDTVVALNPMLVLPSITRVPLEYTATCLILVLLALASGEAGHWVHANVKVPLVAPVVAEFLFLYTLTVVMRLAGLLYHSKKNRLHWNLTGK